MYNIGNIINTVLCYMGFPCGSAGKKSACNVGDLGSIPGLGRSPGEGKGYPLQDSWASFCGSDGKESTCNVGDLGLIPGLGRSSGEEKSSSLQYSGLEISTDCVAFASMISKGPAVHIFCLVS